VHRRNGVPLGHSDSLKNMLTRSLGAGSFAAFWQYWNPIWGYALGRYIYTPLQQILPKVIALILTFTISGGIHDLVATVVRGSGAFLFTPWFTLMGLLVVIGEVFHINYTNQPFYRRVFMNLVYVLGCLFMTFLAINTI